MYRRSLRHAFLQFCDDWPGPHGFASGKVAPREQDTRITIRMPLLLQGMIQGLIGALLALAAMAVGFRFTAPQLAPLLTLALGVDGIAFLPVEQMLAIVIVGTLLGALGGFLARGRRHA